MTLWFYKLLQTGANHHKQMQTSTNFHKLTQIFFLTQMKEKMQSVSHKNEELQPRRSTSQQTWRQSRSTSKGCGMSPSAPPLPRRPNKELARAQPAAHARRAAQRFHHASSIRVRKMEGSGRALALASSRTNVLVSSDHLPPTSPPRTTRRDRERGPTSSGQSAFFPDTVDVGCTRASSTITMERAHQCRWRAACPQTVGGPRQPLPTVSCRVLVVPTRPDREP